MRIWEQWIGWTQHIRAFRHPTSVLGLAVLTVVLVSFVWLNQAGDPEFVPLLDTRELSRDQIGAMQVAFGKAGLNDYEIRGARVIVPRQKRSEYFNAADENGAIPSNIRIDEHSRSLDFLLSPEQRRQLEVDEKRTRVRELLIALSSVEDAKIEYDETRGRGLLDDRQRTATVCVQSKNDLPLDEKQVRAIREIVRGSYSGLQSSNIVVIDNSSGVSFSGADPYASDSLSLPNRKLVEESKYEYKFRNALSAYPGVRVIVEVVLDRMVKQYSQRRHFDGSSQPVMNTVHREISHPGPSSPFAAKALQAGTNGAANVPSTMGIDRTIETTHTLPGGTYEAEERLGAGVTRVSVSIGIPESCVKLLAERLPRMAESNCDPPVGLNDPRTQLAFEKLKVTIQEKIRPLIPTVESMDEQIVVTMDPEIRWPIPTESPSIPAEETTSWWAENWKTLLLIGFGCGFSALFVLRGRSAASTNERAPGFEEREFSTPIASGQPVEEQGGWRRPSTARGAQNSNTPDDIVRWQRSRVPRP